jgi:ADP-heptose:LPS heptosyltransferase
VLRILFFAPQGLGDCLEVTPALRMLRAAVPEARIDVAVLRREPLELFGALPELVDDVRYLPYWERGAPTFARACVALAIRQRYDVSFTAYPAARPEYHFAVRLLGATRRLAHRYAEPTIKNGLALYTTLVDPSTDHNVERNIRLVEAAGFNASRPAAYEIPQAWRASSARDLRRIAIHCGSIEHGGFALKRWPLESFIELGRRLSRRGWEITFIAGPGERESSGRAAAEVSGASVFSGSLPELSRFLSRCALLVSNDTGVAHLANGVNTPVLVLFGPTPLTGGPYGKGAVLLRPSDCPPCFTPAAGITECVRNIGFKCLRKDLPVELVERHALEFVGALK